MLGVRLLRFQKVMRITVSRYFLLALALALSAPVLMAQKKQGGRVTDTKLIGYVSGVDIDGSGCDFQLVGETRRSRRYIFYENDSDGVPYMNIDGRNVRLKLVGSSEPYRRSERKGERFSRRYASGDVKVHMDIVVTSVCAPNDEQCEFTGYKATVTVSKGSRKQTVEAVGGCGS